MIKFQDLTEKDYEPIIDSFDNSNAHEWFKDWIIQGIKKHPRQDVSQASFQRYLNTKDNVPEDCTAYNILKKFKKEKNYELLKKIRIQSPTKRVEKDSKNVDSETGSVEVDLSKVKVEEAPKIITESTPQHVIHDSLKEIPDEPKLEDKRSNSGKIIFGLLVAAIIIGAVIFVLR